MFTIHYFPVRCDWQNLNAEFIELPGWKTRQARTRENKKNTEVWEVL